MRIVAFVGSPVEDNEKDVCFFFFLSFFLFMNDKCFSSFHVGQTVFISGNMSFFFFFKSNLFQLVKLAKRLKKEKVNVDVINFGEEVTGQTFLTC